MATTKPKPGPSYVNVYLDVKTAEALYVALGYALNIQSNNKKPNKKKKKKGKTTPKSGGSTTPKSGSTTSKSKK
jgi:hypothetical protein